MSSPLQPEQLRTLQGQLVAERTRLLQRAGLESVDANEEPSDLQDKARSEVHRRDELALSDRDRARLFEVDAALARIADGVYGICEETGEPIPFRRLQVEPTTRYTVEALELLETEGVRTGRLHESDDDTLY